MERFEFSDGESNKFWEINVEGSEYTVRYGRIGTDGQTKSKSFDSPEVARVQADKMIASKTKKGYVAVDEGGGESAGASAAAASAAAAALVSNPELEQEIESDPESSDAWQVYADWLQENGDPRGEVLALELAGDAGAASALLNKKLDVFLGPLSAHQKTYDDEDTNVFSWKRGFIDGIRLSHNYYADEEFGGKLLDVLELVLAHPSARFLSEITFVFNNDPNEDNLQDLIDKLAERKRPTIRKLHFGDYEYCGPAFETATGETEISWYGIGDLSKLWQAVPNLRTLITQCGSNESAISDVAFELGEIDLPNLTHAEFRTGGLESVNAKAIAAAKIPSIERLDVWYGDENYGGDASEAEVAPLLARIDLPKLRHLGLMNCAFVDELVPLLFDSTLLKQVEALDLSMGCLSDEGAKQIAANKDKFAHLKRLNVNENYLSEEGLAALQAALPAVWSEEQRERDEPDERYTAVAE